MNFFEDNKKNIYLILLIFSINKNVFSYNIISTIKDIIEPNEKKEIIPNLNNSKDLFSFLFDLIIKDILRNISSFSPGNYQILIDSLKTIHQYILHFNNKNILFAKTINLFEDIIKIIKIFSEKNIKYDVGKIFSYYLLFYEVQNGQIIGKLYDKFDDFKKYIIKSFESIENFDLYKILSDIYFI